MERRTIVLREFGSTELSLNSEEARELAACSSASLQLRLLPDGRYQLKAGNQVGTVVLSTVNVLIRPKVPIPQLFQLLSYYYGRTLNWSREGFPFAESNDLYAWLVRFFDNEMERAREFGLSLDYVQTWETLPTVRGRIDTVEQLRRQQLRPYPIECRYDNFTVDIPLNRVLKEAHSVALGIPGIDVGLADRLRERYRRLFSSVQSTEDGTALETQVVHFNHLTAHWQPAYEIANLILQFRAMRDAEGRVVGRAFTVRMDRVYEDFLQKMIGEHFEDSGFEVKAQSTFDLTPRATVVQTDEELSGIEMRPDLVVEMDGKTRAVADIKYKKTDDIGTFKQPDVYQLFTYCAALGVRRGLLIYADGQPHITQRVSLPAYGGKVDIDTIGIDLSRPWDSVLNQVKKVALELRIIASA